MPHAIPTNLLLQSAIQFAETCQSVGLAVTDLTGSLLRIWFEWLDVDFEFVGTTYLELFSC